MVGSIDRFFFRLCPPQDQLVWNRTQDQLGAQMDLHYWKMSAWTSISQPVHDTSSDRGTKRRGDCHISPHSSREVLEPSAPETLPHQRKPIFTLKGRLICQPLSSLSLPSFRFLLLPLLMRPPTCYPEPGRGTITQICHPGNPDTLFPLRQRASDGWWVCSCWGIWQTLGEW